MPPVVVPAGQWRRQTWQSLPAMPLPIRELWAHHSGGGTKTFATLLGNERYHVRTLGWRALGYNFAIVATRVDSGFGRIFVGRDWPAVGGHTSGRNTVSVGVLLVGGWATATRAEVEAAARSLAWLAREGARRGVLVEAVVSGGHRQAPGQQTSCPETAGLEVVARARQLLDTNPAPSEEDIVASIDDLREVIREEVGRAVWQHELEDPRDSKTKRASTLLRYGMADARRTWATLADRRSVADDLQRLRLAARALGRKAGLKVDADGDPDRDIVA